MLFEDYHRSIVGFHGTSKAVGKQLVLRTRAFDASVNDDDCFGYGVHFWEHAPRQAMGLPTLGGHATVVASMIRLGMTPDKDPSILNRRASSRATSPMSRRASVAANRRKHLRSVLCSSRGTHFPESAR